jgi:Protein of unknown function (DUF3037)
MKPYQYKLLRYRYDLTAEEFINVGLVVFSHASTYLKAKVLTKYSRITNFFANSDGKHIKNTISQVGHSINNQAALTELFSKEVSLDAIVGRVLPLDDGCLFFSETRTGVDVDFDLALDRGFARYVNKHDLVKETPSSDEKVWREVYKRYFDHIGASTKLAPHTVRTENDEFIFDRAYKNGVWHLYEPTAFDLSDPTDVKNKVYKWQGKISELAQAQEPASLYFLARMPANLKLQNFVRSKLTSQMTASINIQVVDEGEAEQFFAVHGAQVYHSTP